MLLHDANIFISNALRRGYYRAPEYLSSDVVCITHNSKHKMLLYPVELYGHSLKMISVILVYLGLSHTLLKSFIPSKSHCFKALLSVLLLMFSVHTCGV